MTRSTEPHDLQAERSVLGAVLVEPEQLPALRALLCESDFYRHAHLLVWSTACGLADAGVPIDFLTLRAALESAGKLEDTGGAAYLASLLDGMPRSSNAPAYAQIVKEHADARRMLAALRQAAAAVHEHGATDEALEPLSCALQARDVSSLGLSSERRISAEAASERARRAARRRVDAEERPAAQVPEFETLAARLEQPSLGVRWRITGWQPFGDRVMLVAQFKAGKTTLRDNLSRSLIDGDAFLDVARVTPLIGTLAVIDTEMGAQLDEWLRAQRIRGADRMLVLALRGKASSFNILDPAVRAVWAARLRAASVEYLILDCLRPVLDALGLDEHRDGGRFLVAFDALLDEAGIADALVVHHMGHSNERARGDSRFRDWPAAEWRLVRHDDKPGSPRYITAYGRDVDVNESLLAFDSNSRRLMLAGGSRREAAASVALGDVVAIIKESGGPLSGRKILAALSESEHPRAAIQEALRAGVQPGGGLVMTIGPKRANLYSLSVSAPVRHSAPPVLRSTVSGQCASAPVLIEHGALSTHTGGNHVRV